MFDVLNMFKIFGAENYLLCVFPFVNAFQDRWEFTSAVVQIKEKNMQGESSFLVGNMSLKMFAFSIWGMAEAKANLWGVLFSVQ